MVMVGHIVKEMIHFPDRTMGPVLGSPAAYCSVVAAKLGVRVGVVTKIGSDMPQELLRPFTEVGVDLRGLKREGNYTTASLLIYHESGDKEIRYPHKALPILFEDVPSAYWQSDIFHVCPMDYDAPLETIERLSTLSAMLSVDLGGYGGAHSRTHPDPTEEQNLRALRELVKHFHIVRASEEDCRHLLGPVEGREAEVARCFVDWGAQIGIVTLGKKGAVLATSEGTFRVPALPGPVVDGTGAGDAFIAGFLAEYLRTADPKRSAQFASAVALWVISGTGGVTVARMPTREDVEGMLETATREDEEYERASQTGHHRLW